MTAVGDGEDLPEDSDYTRFLPDVRRWESIEEFLGADTWSRGVQIVMVDGEIHVDLYFGGDELASTPERALPVVLSGAVTKRNGGPGPFFSGIGLGRGLGGAFVCVSDPTLSVDPALRLGWYTGRTGEGVQGHLVRLLDGIAQRSGRELVLAGGSGGGFAAVLLASRLSRPGSAFVWNPQTDLLDYAPDVVSTYLQVVLGLDEDAVAAMDRPQRAAALEAGGIQHALSASTSSPSLRRLLYVQNATDWHVAAHLAPFLEADGYRIGEGRYVNDRDHVVLVSYLSEGHDPPSIDLIRTGVELLLDPAATSNSVVDALQSSGLLPLVDDTMPRDLRPEAVDLQNRARLEGFVSKRGVVSLRLGFSGRSPRHGGVSSIFTLRDSHGDVLGRYPRRDQTVRLELGASTPTVVDAHVKDGFGHRLFEVSAPVTRQPHTVRALIVGSCVTRDTLAFVDPQLVAVGEYVARHSLLAAFTPPGTPPFDLSALSSPFQRRMLEWDAASSLPEIVERVAADTDVVLWDLVDERLGVFDHPDGRTTTDSVELRRAVQDGHVASLPPETSFGSAEHLRRFTQAMSTWRELLARHGLLERTVLLAPAWAERFEDGTPTPPSFGVDAATANLQFGDYVRAARDALGVRVLGTRVDVRAARDHHWGPAPFHYTDDTYVALASEIVSAVRGVTSPWAWEGIADEAIVRVPSIDVRAPSTRLRVEATSPESGVLDVVVHGSQGRPVSFLLHQEARVLEDTGYQRVSRHRFRVPAPGIYRCRAFLMAADGSREPVTSPPVRVH